jgi:ribonuclease J
VRFTEDLNIINKDFFVPTHAPRQDIKLMVQITKPKYILPVIGEYKHQILFKDMALDLGYKDEDILIKNNGDLMIFDETSYSEELNYYETPIENVDGKPLNDYNDQILKDRELMSKDGIIILSILYDNNTGKKLGETDIQTIGFEGKRLVQESLENLVERIINTLDDLKNPVANMVIRDLKKCSDTPINTAFDLDCLQILEIVKIIDFNF